MFASQTMDLYHIETDRKGGYIEFAVRQIYRAKRGISTNSICGQMQCFVCLNERLQKITVILLYEYSAQTMAPLCKGSCREATEGLFW